MAGQSEPKRFIPYAVGALVGVVLLASVFQTVRIVERSLRIEELAVTPDEVVVAAVNAYVGSQELPAGSHLSAVVDFGGCQCGGVVELRILPERELVGNRVFVVSQDSGDAFASEVPGLSRGEARRQVEQRHRCF